MALDAPCGVAYRDRIPTRPDRTFRSLSMRRFLPTFLALLLLSSLISTGRVTGETPDASTISHV